MAISLQDNLDIRNKKQNVERDSFKTIEEMRSFPSTALPPVFHAMLESDGCLYVYNINNSEDAITGKWRKFDNLNSVFSPIITENEGNTDEIYRLDITTIEGKLTTPNLKGKSSETKVSLSDIKPTYNGSLGELVFNTTQSKKECIGWIYTPFGWYPFGNISNITEDIETNYVLNDGKNLCTSDGMIFAVK